MADPEPRWARVITDPAGDTGTSLLLVRAVARVASVSVPRVGLTPNPTLDVRAVDVSENPTTLTVTLTLEVVDASFAAAAPADEGRTAFFFVGWEDGTDAFPTVYLDVRRAQGRLYANAMFERYDACNDWYWCGWRVPFKVEEGSPGRILFEIPRDLLTDPGAGAKLTDWWFDAFALESRDYPLGGPLSPVRVETGDDESNSERRPYTLTLDPRAPPSAIVTAHDVEDAVGDAHAYMLPNPGNPTRGARSELDILGVRFAENPTAFSVAIEVAQVREPFGAHESFEGEVGLPSGRVLEFGFGGADGSRESFAGYCVDEECSEWVDVPFEMVFDSGTPGWINSTLSRSVLGDLPSGGLINLFEVDLMDWGPGIPIPSSRGLSSGGTWVPFLEGDWAFGLPPYRLHYGSAPEDVPAVYAKDDRGDVSFPPNGGPVKAQDNPYSDRYDITWTSSQGFSDRGLDLAVGVLNLTVREPPPGYDAAIYAIALETQGGATMALYYQQAGADRRYLCAPDTLLFGRAPSNPLDTDFVLVNGSISYNPQYGAGSIRMNIPPQCLGMSEFDADVEVTRLAAGSFLMQRLPDGSTRISQFDELRVEEPFVVGGLPAATERASMVSAAWYAVPFGIDNFWDILGIAGAVAMSAGAVVVVQRRRGALKRYLDEIESASRDHPGDPKAQENALLDLRPHVKEALLHGRLSEGHYVIVERRLEDSLSRARVNTLLDVFGELPHRLVLKLQDLLKDGVLSVKDYRLFSGALQGTGLKKSAIENVQRKLREWVVQDRG